VFELRVDEAVGSSGEVKNGSGHSTASVMLPIFTSDLSEARTVWMMRAFTPTSESVRCCFPSCSPVYRLVTDLIAGISFQ
jgi:hypothetical protein